MADEVNTTTVDTSPLNEKYKAFVADNANNINTMYDAA